MLVGAAGLCLLCSLYSRHASLSCCSGEFSLNDAEQAAVLQDGCISLQLRVYWACFVFACPVWKCYGPLRVNSTSFWRDVIKHSSFTPTVNSLCATTCQNWTESVMSAAEEVMCVSPHHRNTSTDILQLFSTIGKENYFSLSKSMIGAHELCMELANNGMCNYH